MLHHKPRIVLVENNPGDAFLAWERLTDMHQGTVQVDVVPSLAQTLTLLATGPVDAVVLDLNLPDSKGLATLRRVRAAADRASIIVVTRGVGEGLREQALAAGAEDVYDKADTQTALFGRSVLYVVERNRARLQQARLQVLLQTVPYAVVVADDCGSVRVANAAALALLGCADPEAAGAHIDFFAADGPASFLSVQHGHSSHRCEVQVVSIEWEGNPARLASVIPLPSGVSIVSAGGPARAVVDAEGSRLRLHNDQRLRSDMLASLSLQISQQMHTITGLSASPEESALEPLQSCYSHHFAAGQPALLAALQA